MNKNEALGLPRGSVKAIIALGITAAGVAMALRGQIAPEQFLPVVILVVNFYFLKDRLGKDETVAPAPKELAGEETA